MFSYKLKELTVLAFITVFLLPLSVLIIVPAAFCDPRRPFRTVIRDDFSEIWSSYKEGVSETVRNLRK